MLHRCHVKPLADLGEGPGKARPPAPLFLVKKKEMTKGRKADRASKTKPGVMSK